MGRPISTQIDPAHLDIVIERIAHEKASVATACEGICSPGYFYRRLTEDPALDEKYSRARGIRADARFEAIDQIMLDLRAGIIDASQARVMVDTVKWQCAHEKPKRYGDRMELAGDRDAPVVTEVLVNFVGAIEGRPAGTRTPPAPRSLLPNSAQED